MRHRILPCDIYPAPVSYWQFPKYAVLKIPLALLVSVISVACVRDVKSPPTPAAQSDYITITGQPANVGDAKLAALAYHDSGAYDRDLAAVGEQAERWIATRAKTAKRPALVLDIDETAFSNWQILKLDDFGRPIAGPCAPALDAPCGWAAWDQLGRDPAIEATLRVFEKARAAGVTVFFITGRPESQRAATERNLVSVGYGDYARLYMTPNDAHFKSAADFKTPVRVEIEQAGYVIVANIGDQPSDLNGGHAEKKFLLPDPFYRVP